MSAAPAEFDVAEPEVSLPNPGTYSGTVRASNVYGSSNTLTFKFTVGTPVVPTWTVQDLGPCAGSQERGILRAPYAMVTGLVMDGRVVLAYSSPEGLAIRRALVAMPLTPED
ncbi:MAG: hypothetical protein GEEBNDBF_01715 [bacterium]|nr:hypothetical protein [bacterium]